MSDLKLVSMPEIVPKPGKNKYCLRFDFVNRDMREWITEPMTPIQWQELFIEPLMEGIFPIIVPGGYVEIGGNDYFEYDKLFITQALLNTTGLLFSWGIKYE